MIADQIQLIDIYEHLFAEKGWKELIEDLSQKREDLKSTLLDSSMPFDQVQFYRGLAAGYRYIIGLETTIEQVKEQNRLGGLPDVI